MNRAEGLERADKVYADSLKVVAAADRANDHTDDEAGEIFDNLKTSQYAIEGHARAHGFNTGRVDDGIDPPSFWPKSAIQRRERKKRCKVCNKPKPYSEFTRVDGSYKFTGTTCDRCIDERSPSKPRRRRNELSGISSVGGAGGRT